MTPSRLCDGTNPGINQRDLRFQRRHGEELQQLDIQKPLRKTNDYAQITIRTKGLP